MEVSGYLHDPTALPQERTLVPIEQDAGWAAEPVYIFWRRKTSLTPAGNNQTLTEENKCFIHTHIFSKSVKAVIVSINEVYRICIVHILINSYPDIIPLSAILPYNTAAKNRLITRKIQINLHDEVFISHRSDYIAHCILGCDTFQLSKNLSVSHRNIQPHSQSR